MKATTYIILGLVLTGMLLSALPLSFSQQKQVVEIQSRQENPNKSLLEKSGNIIQHRMKDFGLKNVDLKVNSGQGSITLTFDAAADVGNILPLLLSKGSIEFYETIDKEEVIKRLGKDHPLFRSINIYSPNYSSAVLGTYKAKTGNQTEGMIFGNSLEGVKLAPGREMKQNGEWQVYSLKDRYALNKLQIDRASSGNKDMQELMISFNEEGAVAWQELSKKNIGRPLAIVIDGLVYAAPVLKSEIKGGKCSISGNFTYEELTLLETIINNDDLPLEFVIVKR